MDDIPEEDTADLFRNTVAMFNDYIEGNVFATPSTVITPPMERSATTATIGGTETSDAISKKRKS